MIRKAASICLGMALLVGIGVVGLKVLAPAESSPVASARSAIGNTRNEAVNAAVDASGVKSSVSDALMSHAGDIAATTGISTTQVQTVIEGLDIEDWQVATLPEGAQAKSTISGSAAGVEATLTTYDDPSYVSVSAYGQTIDLAVPSSAQQYLPLLALAA